MRDTTIEFREYNVFAFARLVFTALTVGTDRIACILLSKDGRTITLGIVPEGTDRRDIVGSYNVGDNEHALVKLHRDPEEHIYHLTGTRGINTNPALAMVLAWVEHLLSGASLDDLFCGDPATTAPIDCHFAKVDPEKPGSVQFVTPAGLVQTTALPAGGYVGREAARSGQLRYLPPFAAQQGAFAIGNWAQVQVLDAQTIEHIPERIDNAAAVCCSIVNSSGESTFEVLDLAQIEKGRITSKASDVRTGGFAFKGTTGPESATAVLTTRTSAPGSRPVTTLVPVAELSRVLGRNVGQQMAAA